VKIHLNIKRKIGNRLAIFQFLYVLVLVYNFLRV